nr:hypothetical protein [Pedobacter glucosidilyticus]
MGQLCPKFTLLILQIYHNSVLIKQALGKYFLTNTYARVNVLQSDRCYPFIKYGRLYLAAPACVLVNVLINGAASFRRIKEEAANRIKEEEAKSKDFGFFRYFRQCLLTKRWPQPALHQPYASGFAMNCV